MVGRHTDQKMDFVEQQQQQQQQLHKQLSFVFLLLNTIVSAK